MFRFDQGGLGGSADGRSIYLIALAPQRANTMDTAQAEAVYELVSRTLPQLGVSDPRCISRSFLLRDSCYAGQIFRCEGFQAMWLLDGEVIEFRDAAGTLVRSASLAVATTRKAA